MQVRALQRSAQEAEWVRRAQAGERAAFDLLAQRYRGLLLALAFARTGDREEAEDLVQEVLAKAWERLPALRKPETFAAWLKAITANACRDWYRRGRPWPDSLDTASPAAPMADPRRDPLEEVLARERRRAWRRALSAIPATNRLALLMHVWGECSYEDIALFLGMPITTVEGRIHRAKTQMRRALGGEAADLLGEPRRQWRKEDERR